ncbi:MAG: uroporphyrinogen decarboxylase, partial [Thermoguttaceae bacterium]|nr:uroporphyrinogen decarboxylase [Thermoguttaceae bacterium]
MTSAAPLLLKALRRETVERPPIWLMRQAGRYMSEYRAVREGVSFLELCKNPRLCADVMKTAVDVIGVDAAIIFSDLLPILEPLGFELSFLPGDGPSIANPFRGVDDLRRVRELEDVSSLDFVFQTVDLTKRAVSTLPVIGFA